MANLILILSCIHVHVGIYVIMFCFLLFCLFFFLFLFFCYYMYFFWPLGSGVAFYSSEFGQHDHLDAVKPNQIFWGESQL